MVTFRFKLNTLASSTQLYALKADTDIVKTNQAIIVPNYVRSSCLSVLYYNKIYIDNLIQIVENFGTMAEM